METTYTIHFIVNLQDLQKTIREYIIPEGNPLLEQYSLSLTNNPHLKLSQTEEGRAMIVKVNVTVKVDGVEDWTTYAIKVAVGQGVANHAKSTFDTIKQQTSIDKIV